ncbi:MAG TPA: cation-transporting P-type ATPase [Polyangiales bacterium]|nr:cation-transporting P-type ATPase [Polyangiales bacterium]
MSGWYARTADEALEKLDVRPDAGLSIDEARKRLREHGPNELHTAETRSWWRVLFDQLNSIVVYLLGAAAIVALATQRWPEGIALFGVIAVNTTIGFVSEWKGVQSMAALRKIEKHLVRVRRAGEQRELEARDLVPGDIVLMEAGELVPADLRLIEAERLRVNEAALTGESVPADKVTEPVGEETALADRQNMLYKGTSIAQGRAVGLAVATGIDTELGRISELAETAEATTTPLQKRLDRLGRRLAWLSIGIAAVVAIVGFVIRKQEATLVVETALALGIAAVPEGVPIIATIALARGMHLMAKRNALVKRLAAVETLGATRVIFTDKTGTLTENRMRLRKIVTPKEEQSFAFSMDDDEGGDEMPSELGETVQRAVEVSVLCNAASLEEPQAEDNPRGDPTEVALLDGGRRIGIERDDLLERRPQKRVVEFEPRLKKMATFHGDDGSFYVAVKGAPAAVLDVCSRIAGAGLRGDQELDDATRNEWVERSNELAREGLRLLAVADKVVESEDAEPYADLCFVGFMCLHDPPREGIKEAIDQCQSAGIRVEMVTGDQVETAEAIGGQTGIIGEPEDPETEVMRGPDLRAPEDLDDSEHDQIHDANIFARVSPEQKLNLIRVYQERGEIVAMTGDGVNDAPALKKADIGVAMGKRGTDAAKQVADIVLLDDAFETIVAAVEQGRVTFANIRKAVMFVLCTNVAEVLAVTTATLVGWTLPLRPMQILYLNMLTDVFPALALGVGPGSGQEMSESPRDPGEPVLTRRHWIEIAGAAVVIGSSVLASLLLAERVLDLSSTQAVTVSFLTLGFGKLWFTFNLRSPKSRLFRNEITRNPWVWAALASCVGLLAAAVYFPPLSNLLHTELLGSKGWALVLGMSLIPFVVGQVVRQLQR